MERVTYKHRAVSNQTLGKVTDRPEGKDAYLDWNPTVWPYTPHTGESVQRLVYYCSVMETEYENTSKWQQVLMNLSNNQVRGEHDKLPVRELSIPFLQNLFFFGDKDRGGALHQVWTLSQIKVRNIAQ